MPYYFEKVKHYLPLVAERIERSIYQPVAELNVMAWLTPEPVPYDQRLSGQQRQLAVGESWGKLWDCAWMRLTGQVPAEAKGHRVVLLIDISGEALLVDRDGNPALGLTTVKSDYDYSLGEPGKRVVEFLENAGGGEPVDIWLDAANNDLFGRLQNNGTLKEASIAICNENMRQLSHDVFVLNELVRLLPEDSARRAQILAALHHAANVLIDYTDDEAAHARQVLAPQLARTGGIPSLTLSAIGHAHIDLAWLWPIRETIRKGARTFATVLNLMDRYPEYVFGASQAQLYQWMKTYYPALYTRIKQKIAEGRWEVQGGMWVEADVNISGGEALVRQLLHGTRFFQQEFGITPRTLWLPDVFGYTAALPQILKKAGIDYFMTIKISWSKFNTFPHHTFWWEGIDGSKVLAHMPPEGTYNSSAAPRAIVTAEKEFRDKYVSDQCLLLFGIGDGGGGPGMEHLERLAREKNLAGLAPVRQEPAESFFDCIARDTSQYQTWNGELYLEFHQGTHTSQARNKRYNRKLELALRDLELVAALVHHLHLADYPSEALDAIWKEMLLYQFHDVLPGSSITRVYDESRARYAVLMDQVEQLFMQASTALTNQIDTSSLDEPVVVINSLSWNRVEWLKIGGTWEKVAVPALGYATVSPMQTSPVVSALQASPTTLENNKLRVIFAADGSIISIMDKEYQREVINAPANVLAVYDDPGDAWDFAFNYDEKVPSRFSLVESRARVEGPQAIVEQSYRFGQSTLTQQIILTAGSRRLDFVTRVDWHESEKMLRTSFPTVIRASEATYDIQFGSVRRPTHGNTSWDMARREVPAHKWVDLSQRDYGVALLNDCKYGHKIREHVIDLNLLRSPNLPDPQADRGTHEFTYALLPHTGDYVAGRVVQAAYELNVPLRTLPTTAHPGKLPPVYSFLQVDADNVVVEAVKKAEDDDSLIVRLYEASGASSRAPVHLDVEAGSVALTSLVEKDPKPLLLHDSQTEIPFSPFEIQTLKIAR